MNHQHFENWLLSEEPIPPDQAEELREHLLVCEACSHLKASWLGARHLIRLAPQVGPAPGFGARWQERLAAEKHRAQHRQAMSLFGVTLGAAITLLIVLAVPALELLRSPGNLLLLWVFRVLSLVALADTITDTAASVLTTVFRLVPAPAWLLVFGVLSMLSVLWVVFYQQLTSPRRIRL